MNTTKEPTIIEIYAGNAWQVDLLKSILEDAGIQCFIKNGNIGSIAPHYTAGGVGSVQLCISSNNMERAKELVEEFKSKAKVQNSVETHAINIKIRNLYSGELLFNENRIQFKISNETITLLIVSLFLLSLVNGLNAIKHFNNNDLFDQIFFPLAAIVSLILLVFILLKYPLAKKMNKVQFEPKDIKTVDIKKTMFGIGFTIHLENNSEYRFKCKQDAKSDKWIAFLKKSEAKLTIH